MRRTLIFLLLATALSAKVHEEEFNLHGKVLSWSKGSETTSVHTAAAPNFGSAEANKVYKAAGTTSHVNSDDYFDCKLQDGEKIIVVRLSHPLEAGQTYSYRVRGRDRVEILIVGDKPKVLKGTIVGQESAK
jgi:hypothetical protein